MTDQIENEIVIDHSGGKCRGCQRALVWVRMASGKRMPCNVNSESGIEPEHIRVLSNGKTRAVVDAYEARLVFAKGDTEQYGWEQHWATCPAAKLYKKRKAKTT